ncbi:MAG TPA: hypothetical protein VFS26_10155 [Solirubrobacterales bacterium]|nr:hypothetical protein [Solirubrobacterales bacterium]
MEIGIGLAAAVALMTNLASLLKHRGCQHAQPVCIGRPLASLRGLAASPWFAAGWGLAALAWLAHVAALSMAPISLVQAVLAGGAVTLAVLSQRIFGERVERRQWLALALGGAGLGLLAATLPHFHGAHSGFSLAGIASFEGGLAQYTAVAALQSGGAIETIGLMGIVANATQIVGGIVVFGDPLSPSPIGIALQLSALAMVCLSALLLPSSVDRDARRLQPG